MSDHPPFSTRPLLLSPFTVTEVRTLGCSLYSWIDTERSREGGGIHSCDNGNEFTDRNDRYRIHPAKVPGAGPTIRYWEDLRPPRRQVLGRHCPVATSWSVRTTKIDSGSVRDTLPLGQGVSEHGSYPRSLIRHSGTLSSDCIDVGQGRGVYLVVGW